MQIVIDNCRWYDTLCHPDEMSIERLKELLQDLKYIEEDISKFIEAKSSTD